MYDLGHSYIPEHVQVESIEHQTQKRYLLLWKMRGCPRIFDEDRIA